MAKRLLLGIVLVAVVGCAIEGTSAPTSAPAEATALLPEKTVAEDVTSAAEPTGRTGQVVALPAPETDGEWSLEAALVQRRSVRNFAARPLTDAEVGQLLWAAQGITGKGGGRTAPSAGALYPLEVYIATADGLFHYEVDRHALTVASQTDLRPALYEAAGHQAAVGQAPAVFVISAVYERTTVKYGTDRSPRYVHLEAGHAAQNLLLQAVALGLGAVPVGAFDDAGVHEALSLPTEEKPLYLIPVGEP
jgi:SagB-type dehydrogenase family enzyme